MTDIILVRVNCSSLGEADTIGRKVIEAGLAACANIDGPLRSLYEWDGRLESGEEYVLWLKTTASLWPEAEALILELHSFDTPAILAIPCQYANARYEAWLHSSTGRP
jgi:periplasmic divalent cation tolerance protein